MHTLFLLLMISCTLIHAQDTAYTIVQQMPEFPGGSLLLDSFIRVNIIIPADVATCPPDRRGGKTKSVILKFIVRTDGTFSNVSVTSIGKSDAMHAEALRLLAIMPAWVPGRQAGRAVDVWYTLPIVFSGP